MEPTREIMWNVHWMRWPIYGPALIAFGIMAWGFWKEYGRRSVLFRAARPDDERRKELGRRIFDALRYLFGHQRILRETYPGVMHWLVFFGFFVLFVVTLLVMVQEDFTALFFGVEFLKGPTYLVWSLAGDVFGLGLLIGAGMALVRRYIARPKRLDSRPMELWALLLILGLLLTGFFAESLRMVGDGEVGAPWAPWSPVGWLGALLLRGTGMGEGTVRLLHAVDWQVHMVLALVFVATIPWSKFWHMVPGFANVVLRNEAPKGDLPTLDMEDLEDETRETFGIHRVDTEGPARHRGLHAMWPLYGRLPGVRHGQAAEPQEDHPGSQGQRRREARPVVRRRGQRQGGRGPRGRGHDAGPRLGRG